MFKMCCFSMFLATLNRSIWQNIVTNDSLGSDAAFLTGLPTGCQLFSTLSVGKCIFHHLTLAKSQKTILRNVIWYRSNVDCACAFRSLHAYFKGGIYRSWINVCLSAIHSCMILMREFPWMLFIIPKSLWWNDHNHWSWLPVKETGLAT